jgi:anti-sigma regulatory factor (Ser/Thr protein kinase)
MLERVVTENQRMAADKGLLLRFRKSSAWTRTDPTLVHSILSNFVSNAIRCTNNGRIVVGIRRSGEQLRLEVWDSGTGIPEPELRSVFRDFYQVHGARKPGAMGMGLPLALRMARLLGATVMARSTYGKGSRFAISLPAAKPPAATTLIPPLSSAFQHHFEQKRALLLDSDHSRLQRTHRLLSDWKLAAHPLNLDEARALSCTPPQAPVDVLIACLPGYRDAEHSPLIQALRQQHRPKHTLLILDETLEPDTAARLPAKDLHVFYRPLPPWRLRMILWRVLSST